MSKLAGAEFKNRGLGNLFPRKARFVQNTSVLHLGSTVG